MNLKQLYNTMIFLNILVEHIKHANTPFVAWVFGYIGWVIYNLYILNKVSKEYDKNQDGYDKKELGKYFKKNAIPVTISFLLVIVGVIGMPLLWAWLGKEGVPFHVSAYFGAGFLAVGLQKLMEKK